MELERLSGSRIEVLQEAPVDGKRKLTMKGSAVAVTRARVLIEDKLRSAPSKQDVSRVEEPQKETRIMVAGRCFADRDQLVSHIRALQGSLTDGAMLGPEDAFFVFHLATYHPNFVEKMIAPIVGFKYGPHESFGGSKCFFVVRVDGSEEGISIMKCVEAVAPRHGQGKQTGEQRQQKRPRDEEAGNDSSAVEPPFSKPRREFTTGCVVIIDGVPSDYDYESLRDILSEFGDVRFVEMLRNRPSAPAAPAADATQVESIKDKAEDKAEEKAEDKAEDKAEAKPDSKVDGMQVDADGGDKAVSPDTAIAAAPAKDGEAKEAEQPASTEDGTVSAPADSNTAPQGDAKAAAADDEDDEMEEANDVKAFISSRARFSDAEGAARTKAELKDLDGSPVNVRILDGDEEREFWERLWAKSDANKGKGKGKGKDKGKGKGKGKSKGKGKGKSKGKGW